MQIILLDFLTSCWLRTRSNFVLYFPNHMALRASEIVLNEEGPLIYLSSALLDLVSLTSGVLVPGFLMSCNPLVLLSSNHPSMLFSLCPLVVLFYALLYQRTHCFSGFLIFRTDTNVSRYLLKLWSVYSRFPGLLALLSYCPLDFLTCLASSSNPQIFSTCPSGYKSFLRPGFFWTSLAACPSLLKDSCPSVLYRGQNGSSWVKSKDDILWGFWICPDKIKKKVQDILYCTSSRLRRSLTWR